VIVNVERDERSTKVTVESLIIEGDEKAVQQIANYARAIARKANAKRSQWRIEED
jgi:hypothetical protein